MNKSLFLKKGMRAMNGIILFDGECNFCDKSVQFIIKRDRSGYFKFASLQSKSGQKRAKQYQIPDRIDSFILIDNKKWHSKSSAALRVCKDLNGLWKVFYPMLLIPRPIRDFFYGIIASNRFKWFGTKKSCAIPTPEIRKRFL